MIVILISISQNSISFISYNSIVSDYYTNNRNLKKIVCLFGVDF